ncbi:hypothetical protein PHET_12341 [Paragonimus heterotremus]|uniref:Uncharacterized protein n=1 Tax=Paragonimus heterotremus TaxID=100268 RepID=A0A8J4SPF2_9TREM|nr:hypothetical protein PHET_12341 [Paragonimus heterotremus]
MSDHKSKKYQKGQKKPNRLSSSSESEYEWTDGKDATEAVETPPDTSKCSTWIGGTQSMEDFLDGFATVSKSKTKMIASTEKPVNELNPYWKDGGVGFPSTEHCDKISKSTKSALTKENEAWLFKSYNNCLEKARSEHVDVETLLLQRWDEATVEAMLARFGTFHDSRKGQRGYGRCRWFYADDEQ